MESPFPEPIPTGTRLIETFGWWPGAGARHLPAHLARMAQSAAAFGFSFDRDKASEMIAELIGPVALRCRLTLGIAGDLDLTVAPHLPAAQRPWRVAIHPERLQSDDPWLGHKSTNRALYDRARASLPAGVDECLFLNERGDVCEGTITNLFVTLSDGRKVTPPQTSGLLPGILRKQMLDAGEVVELPVSLNMLHKAQAVRLCNSLRGEMPAQLVM